MKLGLYQKKLLAVDGSKFRAVNADKRVLTAEALEKKLANIEEKIISNECACRSTRLGL